jgi:fructose-1,6-bisphosphatase/inositol monophosphatase family enzyme
MTTIDVTTLAGILRDAAKAEILPRFRRLDRSMVKTKSEAIDLVTEADLSAERVITARIGELWPEALVVGEEAVAATPELLTRLGDAELAITLDPVDGTANFAAGLPVFAVMAAVVVKAEVVAGIIYDPMGDDWLMAERGAGAWLVRADGERARHHVAEPVPLAQMVGSASPYLLPYERRQPILSNLHKVRLNASYRCAGHEYRMMCGGHLHYLMYGKLMPWDHLPGSTIALEAGGYVGRLDGSRYEVSHTGGGLIVTTDRDSFETLRREVFAPGA